MESKKIYLASDFHLGLDIPESSAVREKKIVAWLDAIKADCGQLYLVGDVFDFWFEYTAAIPKGHTRLLGKLAEFCDAGIEVSLFTGNHDMWMFEYFQKELGVKLFKSGVERQFLGNPILSPMVMAWGPAIPVIKLSKPFSPTPFVSSYFIACTQIWAWV